MSDEILQFYAERLADGTERWGLPRDVIEAAARAANDLIRFSGKFYRLHHDFETFNDVSVVDVGSDVYARRKRCEVLMCAYACNDEDILQWLPAEGQPMPADLDEMMDDPNAVKFAWNKPFEHAIWQHVLKKYVPHHQWRDPMVMAFSCSLPGSLEKAGKIVELEDDQQKMKRGKLLIRKFCMPRKPTKNNPSIRLQPWDAPEEWEEFKLYNRTDVEAERGIYRKLKRFDLPRHEWENWFIDQEINQAGIPINLSMVRNAITIHRELVEETTDELKALTGLDNPNSTKQLLPWLREYGYPFEDLKAGHVKRGEERAREQLKEWGISDDEAEAKVEQIIETRSLGGEWHWEDEWEEIAVIARVLWLRVRAAKASPKKYYALVKYSVEDEDGAVLRNAFQFAGAGRTWRWAGRAFQAQNLPRPANKLIEKAIVAAADHVATLYAPALKLLWPDAFDVLTSTIRPCAQAPDGYLLIDADLNAIENRVLGWLAKCRKILRVFEENRDPYIDFATYLFGGTYAERWAEYKELGDSTKRTISKPGVLGCGYMLGAGEQRYNKKTAEVEATGLLGYAWGMGIKEFTQEQSKLSVDTFRREFEEVKDYWYGIERAAKKCIRTGNPTRHHDVRFDMKAPFLRMILPSGRCLHYCRPRLEMVKAPWGEMKESITYEGLNTKKQWIRQSTHPGKLTENADQAISRDIIMNGMRIAKREYQIDIRIHVHDQIVGLVREDEAEERLEQLKEAMSRPIEWAGGLPLGAAGHISKIFIKD